MMDFRISFQGDRALIELQGRCDYSLSKKQREALSEAIISQHKLTIDFKRVSKADFVFCAFIYGLIVDKDTQIIGTNTRTNEIFQTLSSSLPKENEENAINNAFSLKISHMVLIPLNEAGFKALPVALLTAFIVSYAIALQGVLQLEKMGVPLMSVEIVAKLSLRELGPFILAIVIAGRSSSAFSAQLGVMNLTEENDALKTMNLSLFDYLILPRVLALIIVMPLLVFLADSVSLFAAMLAVKMQTGINFMQYLERFYEYVGINHFLVGMIKAPFFGAAIALVGCFRGLYVKGDTESIGLETTKSVVNALFWVILINAIFSVITTRLDI